jgi:hypothetical protein
MNLGIFKVIAFGMLSVHHSAIAQTISPYSTSAYGIVAEVAGVLPSQTVVGVSEPPAVIVLAANGAPLQGVRVRFSAVPGDWYVEFSGQPYIDALTDLSGVAVASGMKPIVKEAISNYDKSSMVVARFNISASAPDFPIPPATILGKMYATPITNACGAPAITLNASRPTLRLESAGQDLVRVVLSDSSEPLRGVDFLDGDRVVFRIPILAGTREIDAPRDINTLRARFAGTCSINAADSNLLSKDELRLAAANVPTNGKDAVFLLVLLVAFVPYATKSRRASRT